MVGRAQARAAITKQYQAKHRHRVPVCSCEGILAEGPPTEAEDVAKAKDRGGEIGILTPKQLADLFEAADEEAKLYSRLGAFSGLRSAELIRLEWQDVNFDRAHIHVGKAKSKTATRRLVPIQPNLMQWLSPYRGQTGLVFSSEHAAIRAIGTRKKNSRNWPSNALRHSYATYRLAQCNDVARVALEMGNSPQMLFRNYRELADEQDAAAWFGIAPALLRQCCADETRATRPPMKKRHAGARLARKM